MADSPDESSSAPDADVDRRAFFSTSSLAMAGGLVAGYGTFFVMAGRYLYPAGDSPKTWMFLTDEDHKVVYAEPDPAKRKPVVDTAAKKRERMKNVCAHCHTLDYVAGFYKQYDDFVVLYNEKFAKPGVAIMGELAKQGLLTKTPFDEEIEWTWFYLWHHEGRRARHGASMMAPDYAHWHGTYEVAERFYQGVIPQAREIVDHARSEGKPDEAPRL